MEWSEWSSCPVCYEFTDAPVTTLRTREHTCSGEVEENEKTCLAPRCAYWTAWGSWSACSVSCHMGQSIRVRSCAGSDEFCANLVGVLLMPCCVMKSK